VQGGQGGGGFEQKETKLTQEESSIILRSEELPERFVNHVATVGILEPDSAGGGLAVENAKIADAQADGTAFLTAGLVCPIGEAA